VAGSLFADVVASAAADSADAGVFNIGAAADANAVDAATATARAAEPAVATAAAIAGSNAYAGAVAADRRHLRDSTFTAPVSAHATGVMRLWSAFKSLVASHSM